MPRIGGGLPRGPQAKKMSSKYFEVTNETYDCHESQPCSPRYDLKNSSSSSAEKFTVFLEGNSSELVYSLFEFLSKHTDFYGLENAEKIVEEAFKRPLAQKRQMTPPPPLKKKPLLSASLAARYTRKRLIVQCPICHQEFKSDSGYGAHAIKRHNKERGLMPVVIAPKKR